MGTVEELRQRLVDGGVLTAEAADVQLAAWREETSMFDDMPAEDFVDWLIEEETITEFQGDAVVEGHSGPFMLGHYRVFEQIAPGRLGGMFRAVHEEFDQPVTLKVFPSTLKLDPEKVARMGREVRIFAELDHPNVVRSFQVGHVGDIYYIALEELRGETLESRLERDTRLPYEEACRIISDVARGLQHLHQNEVLHRDLRPANIWVGENGVAKVMEFGAARDAFAAADVPEGRPELTRSDQPLGQYQYMSPEQAEDVHLVDGRSDIYALGCTFFHALTGRPPFVEPNPVQLVIKHLKEPPPRASEIVDDVPAPLDDTLNGMLAKEPGDRFQSADQVAFALDQYLPAEEAERVEIVHVSDEYLEWARSHHTTEHHVSEDAVGITPELAEFLGWMSQRDVRRQGRVLR